MGNYKFGMADMEAGRWQQVKQLFAAAEKLSVEERTSFLRQACPNDPELQRYLESLLEWHDKADTFLEQFTGSIPEPKSPAAGEIVPWQILEDLFSKGLHANKAGRDLLLEQLSREAASTLRILWATADHTDQATHIPALSPGDRIGRFEVVSQLGSGGMGEVYLAHDPDLARNIAIKVLPPAFAADKERVRRLHREGRAASALKHANVLTIYELGELEGRTFLVTEYVEGRTLKDRLAAGPMPVNEALAIATEVARGLQAAHQQGVVHRDIKPANIMILPDGHIKILDFGLALGSDDQTLTQSGTVMGTPTYMSPEQRKGESVDARTDIWSLGVLIYEMIAGRLPFPQTCESGPPDSLLRTCPEPVSRLRAGLPGKLDSILSRCLARDRQDRYPEVGELIADLQSQRVVDGLAQNTGEPAKRRTWFVLAAALTLFVCTGLWMRHARTPHVAPSVHRSAAVLPFRNASLDPNQQYLADGMTNELITTLSKITALRVIPHASVMRYKNNQKPVAEVARELSVDMIVDGSVMRVGDHVRVSARLVHALSNETHWMKTYDRPLEGLPLLQSEVARGIASTAGVALTPGEGRGRTNGSLGNPKAYDLFLRGQHALYQPGEATLREAVAHFKEAALYDPGLSLAHIGLAEAWLGLSSWYIQPHDAMPNVRAAALRALEREPELADAHSALGNVALFYEWDWSAAEQHFLKAIRLNPNSSAAHRGYSDYLLGQRRFDEAIAQGKRGVELDPFSLLMRGDYLLSLATAGRNDEAIKEAQRAIDVEPEFSLALAIRGLARSAKKLHGEAVRDLEQAVAIERTPTNLGFLAYVQAAAGHRPAALRVLQELRRMAATRYVCPFEIGIAYSGFGDRDEAFRWMEKAIVDRADCMVMLAAEPWAEGIRKDHRFDDLLRRVGLQTVAAR